VFDVGFTELMVIAVVALIVIGPERLPRVARTLGHLFGRLQRYVNDVKADISREIELEELKKFKSTFEDAARGVESEVNTEINSVQSEVTKTQNEVSSELNSLAKIEDPTAAPPIPPGPVSGETSLTPSEIGLEPRSEAPAKPEKTTV
jgi:sec-independent protein translocase protein TatB